MGHLHLTPASRQVMPWTLTPWPTHSTTWLFGNYLNLMSRMNQHGLIRNAFERTSLPCMYPRCTFWVGFVYQTRTYPMSVLQLCGRYLIFYQPNTSIWLVCVVKWRSINKHCKDTYLKATRLRLQANHSIFNSGQNWKDLCIQFNNQQVCTSI